MEGVLPSVQLYDHFLFQVHKIHNLTANGLLATKLETFYLSVCLSDTSTNVPLYP